MELVVRRHPIDFLDEEVSRRRVVALSHRPDAAIEVAEGRIGLDLVELLAERRCLPVCPNWLRTTIRFDMILGLPGSRDSAYFSTFSASARVAVTLIDDPERVVGAQEARVLRDRRARPPVRVVDLPAACSASAARLFRYIAMIVLLVDDRASAARGAPAAEENRSSACVAPAASPNPTSTRFLAERQVHMADEEMDVVLRGPRSRSEARSGTGREC